MNLTHRQQRFTDEYLLDLNSTKAAIRAGYSSKTARQMAAQNMSKPAISNVIAMSMQQRSEHARVDSNWVLQAMLALYKEAREAGDMRFAIKALETIGKHVNVQAFK
jgi:phage terminase small subunit